MDENLLPGGENPNDVLSASQASLQRSSSLLERIRAQRERENVPNSSTPSNLDIENGSSGFLPANVSSSVMDSDPGPLPVPNYAPIGNDAMGSSPGPSNTNPMGMSSVMSLNFSQFVRGLGSRTADQEAAQGLLVEEVVAPDGSYSMTAYLRMFITDVYSYFRALPIPAQAFVIVIMLWIIWKLI